MQIEIENRVRSTRKKYNTRAAKLKDVLAAVAARKRRPRAIFRRFIIHKHGLPYTSYLVLGRSGL